MCLPSGLQGSALHANEISPLFYFLFLEAVSLLTLYFFNKVEEVVEGSRAKLDVSFSGLILLCIEDMFLCISESAFNAVLVVLSQCASLVFAVLGTNFFHRVVEICCFP